MVVLTGALVLSVCLAAAGQSFDYCTIHCPSGGTHVLCDKTKGADTFMSELCKGYKAGLAAGEKTMILDLINKKRARVASGQEKINTQPSASNMLALKWDPELEATAQAYAKECDISYKDGCRLLQDNSPFQQLMDSGDMPMPDGDARQLTINMVIQKWYEGVLTFFPKEVPAQGGRSDTDIKDMYAQLVWAKTSRVGCGYVDADSDEGKHYSYKIVCNFSPPGNVDGEAVYQTGAPASACPDGYKASPAYAGLCEEGLNF